jgi:hypothetical protein
VNHGAIAESQDLMLEVHRNDTAEARIIKKSVTHSNRKIHNPIYHLTPSVMDTIMESPANFEGSARVEGAMRGRLCGPPHV